MNGLPFWRAFLALPDRGQELVAHKQNRKSICDEEVVAVCGTLEMAWLGSRLRLARPEELRSSTPDASSWTGWG